MQRCRFYSTLSSVRSVTYRLPGSTKNQIVCFGSYVSRVLNRVPLRFCWWRSWSSCHGFADYQAKKMNIKEIIDGFDNVADGTA
jgi:hypothetical protein